jgi:hypothetical protein
MSITIMTQVWKEEETSGSERLVLLALADIANDDGVCWPSMQTVAKKCNLSRRYIIDMIASLEGRNYLRRQKRLGNNGKLTSNIYKIQTHNLRIHPSTSEPYLTNLVMDASLDSEVEFTNLVNPASQNPPLNTSINPHYNKAEEAPVKDKVAAAANLDKLISLGVGKNRRTQKIANSPNITPDIIERHAKRLTSENRFTPGLLITCLENNDPVPVSRERDARRYAAWEE